MVSSRLLAIGALVVTPAVAARPAAACSSSLCAQGHFVPGDGVTVPANLRALYWRPMNSQGDPASVTLTTAAGVPVAFTAQPEANGDHVLRLDADLVPGTTYVLADGSACPGNPMQPGPRVTFTAGAASSPSGFLGELTQQPAGRGTIELETRGGSCSSDAEVDSASISVVLGAEAAPWRDVLQYQTFVDGAAWRPRASLFQDVAPGASWRGRGADLVYTICASEDPSLTGLDPGPHTVTMSAAIPGFATGFQTEGVTVELDCDAPPATCDDEPCDDGGCAMSGRGAAPWLVLALVAPWLRRRRA